MLLAKMNAIETANQIAAALQALVPLLTRLARVASKATSSFGTRVSYENLLLDLTLDLRDATGGRAYVQRRQRVLFKTNEAGVIRNLVWGEGTQVKKLASQGGRRVATAREGSREVLLLALARPGQLGKSSEITTDETLSNAFRESQEYFEASVERPTHSLRLRIVFPKARPPKDVYLDAGWLLGRKSVPVRIAHDGRARVTQTLVNPALDRVYGLRWSW